MQVADEFEFNNYMYVVWPVAQDSVNISLFSWTACLNMIKYCPLLFHSSNFRNFNHLGPHANKGKTYILVSGPQRLGIYM